MDDTASGKHLVEAFLTFPWSPCFRFHLDKKHLVVTHTKPEEVKETVWQALDDVLAIHAEKFSRVSSEDLAAVFGQCHHGEFLNVRLTHD